MDTLGATLRRDLNAFWFSRFLLGKGNRQNAILEFGLNVGLINDGWHRKGPAKHGPYGRSLRKKRSFCESPSNCRSPFKVRTLFSPDIHGSWIDLRQFGFQDNGVLAF